jgi:uncharacterized protein (DUF885 family)
MHMTRRAVLGATTATFALAAVGCARQNAGGNAELNAILDRLSTQFLHESPEYATALAVTEEQAGGRYIDRLSDVSREGQQRQLDLTQAGLTDLRALNRERLQGQDGVTYDVVVTALQDTVDASQFKFGNGAQAPYTVTQLTGAYTNIPDFLASQHPVTNREQADAYLTRLAAYPRMLDQETTRIGQDAADGVIPPDFCLLRRAERGREVGAIGQLRAFARTAPAENVLVTSLRTNLQALGDVSDADKTALVQRAETIVRDEVYPAYQRQIEALQAIQPRAVHDAGCWRLPRGEELYAAALKAYTTTTMTPDEIHNMGVELVNQFNGEMDAILRSQGMTRGTVAERVRALSQRPDQIYQSTPAGREALLASLNAQVEAIRARMPEQFGTLARAPLEVKRVPEYTEAGAPGGYYQNAALDGSRPGAYYINLRNPAEEWPKFTLPTLTYHEGIPGHHWQISIQQEAGSIPFIRSALLGFSAYAEGWGLYAEQLADEMGMYQNDPFGRVGYLQSAAFRASRCVVDTGMHSKRWTREQAIASMMHATGVNESNVVTEIERYAVWPGQACSYMVGRQAINRMREGARTALGDAYDQKGFHDTLLTNGSAPLSVSESLINEWVASRRNA